MTRISIEKMKKLRNTLRVSEAKPRSTVREQLIRLFNKRREFLDMDELMSGLGLHSSKIHTHLQIMMHNGTLVRIYVDSRAFYGLPDFLE